MRVPILAAVAACALAVGACQSTSVRDSRGERVATVPRSMVLHRGESSALQVAIDRDDFRGPVTVSLSQLPKGVEVDRATQKVETDMATFALKASRDADLVRNQAVAVTLDGDDGRRATQYVTLSIQEAGAQGGD
jgi:hypothetical protein